MPDRWRVCFTAIALCLTLSSCTPAASGPPSNSATVRGGTLRVVEPLTYPYGPQPSATTLDPVLTMTFGDTYEFGRCCLARTLLSYNGQPTASGGADLRPDLAVAMPEISTDGLTWTFRLRPGLHYAPPYQNTEIVAGDFIRALARTARLSVPGGPPILSVIRGFDDFAAGKTASIPGLEAPDPHTLVVRLNQPEGDLGYRLSTENTAPVAPLRRDPGAPFGVYTGHDAGLGGLVVSSGPYMIEGADTLDLEAPVAQQHDPRGFVAGKSITLVRNPSWSISTDTLRPALADRIAIDFTINTIERAAAAIDAGQADIALTIGPPPQAPLSQVRAYQADPRRGRVEIDASDGIRYVSMNLAVAPFDDLHVRRAVAYVIDRPAMLDAHGGSINGPMTGHIALDSMEDRALLTFDPYHAADTATRLQLAREEMALSRYDSSHSGRCDSIVCRHVVALTLVGQQHPPEFGRIVHDDLAQIGIDLDSRDLHAQDFFTAITDPATRTPLAIGWAWHKDYPNGSDFFTSLFSHDGFATQSNFSLLGATPSDLQHWGYTVSAVPSVDDRVAQCLPLVGGAQAHCWATLDAYMMERVVAVVPIVTESHIEVIPARVAAYSFDQAFNLPALDRIVVSHG